MGPKLFCGYFMGLTFFLVGISWVHNFFSWVIGGFKKFLDVIFLTSICDALCDLVSFVQFKKRENTHGGVLLLVKLQVFSFMDFLTFFKLYKWYQIAKSITIKYDLNSLA